MMVYANTRVNCLTHKKTKGWVRFSIAAIQGLRRKGHYSPMNAQIAQCDPIASERILATGPVPKITEEVLCRFGQIQVAPKPEEQVLIPLVSDAIGLIVGGDVQISQRVIAAGKRLRVIGRSGVGCENVDVAAATARGIPLIYTPGSASRPVAEGAMALMLALAKNLLELDHKTKEGDWQVRHRNQIADLDGSILGIIGLGQIGRELAGLAGPFGMRILTFDPYVSLDKARKAGVEVVDLDFLLAQSDFIALVAPLTAETKGMIDTRRLGFVKHGTILVNLGRGALLESLDAVYKALEDGRLGAVGLDVYPVEPPDVSHPIFRHPKVLCTPHAMGLSVLAKLRTHTMMSEGMAAVFDGKIPRNVFNPEVFRTRSEA
jgi:D-3-phosphoglycerate dehydrogenase